MHKLNVIIVHVLFVSVLMLNAQRPSRDWGAASGQFDRTLIEELKAEIGSNKYKQINSIVVIRDGRLLIEEYFNGANRESLHDSRSVGKSFTSAILGVAIKEGHIKDLDQPLSAFYDLRKFKNFSDEKAAISLCDLITMSSVFDGDDNDPSSPGNEENLYPQPNWVEWILNLPVRTTKATSGKWHYFAAGVALLGDILNSKVPGGLESYADKKLFKPLGISKFQWVYTPQGIPSTAGGLRLRPLDLAKFGQMYKDGGRWKGKQIVPKEWVNASFQKRWQTPFGEDGYGFLWWNKNYYAKSGRYETFFASGNGGNKIFVFTELPLVIVITASAYNRPYMHPQVDEIITKFILPAVVGTNDKRNRLR